VPSTENPCDSASVSIRSTRTPSELSPVLRGVQLAQPSGLENTPPRVATHTASGSAGSTTIWVAEPTAPPHAVHTAPASTLTYMALLEEK
jgi:hypothetical protein